MAYVRKEGENRITWVIENSDGPLSARVEELSTIFDYYAKRKESINDDFTMQLLSMQAKALAQLARQQEAELKKLRALEADMAALKKDMAEMKSPQSLEKKKLPAPK